MPRRFGILKTFALRKCWKPFATREWSATTFFSMVPRGAASPTARTCMFDRARSGPFRTRFACSTRKGPVFETSAASSTVRSPLLSRCAAQKPPPIVHRITCSLLRSLASALTEQWPARRTPQSTNRWRPSPTTRPPSTTTMHITTSSSIPLPMRRRWCKWLLLPPRRSIRTHSRFRSPIIIPFRHSNLNSSKSRTPFPQPQPTRWCKCLRRRLTVRTPRRCRRRWWLPPPMLHPGGITIPTLNINLNTTLPLLPKRPCCTIPARHRRSPSHSRRIIIRMRCTNNSCTAFWALRERFSDSRPPPVKVEKRFAYFLNDFLHPQSVKKKKKKRCSLSFSCCFLFFFPSHDPKNRFYGEGNHFHGVFSNCPNRGIYGTPVIISFCCVFFLFFFPGSFLLLPLHKQIYRVLDNYLT